MKQPAGGLRATLIVSVARLLYTALAFALGVLSARYFGTSAAKDSYLIAQTIPGLVTTFLIGGIYSSLLIALVEVGRGEGIAGQVKLMRRTLWSVFLILSPFVAAALLVPEGIIASIAPGFGTDRLEMSAGLLRLTALTAVGAVSFTVIRCLFETRLQFGVPCFVHLLIPLTSLVTLAVLAERIGIFALALGPLIGQVAGVALLVSLVRRVLRDPPGFVPAATATADAGRRNRRFWISLVPMSLAANFGHINLLVDNAFASYLPTGAITMLGFAFVIVSNSELLTTLSLAEVSFARLASSALQGTEALRETLRWSLRYMTLVTAPLSAGALVFGMPLVRLLFQRGQFTAESTLGVSRTLMCYSLEILFMGYVVLFMRLLFARKRIGFVAWTSSGAILANIVLDYLLMKPFGINGIALATTCVALLHLLVLIPIVRREVPAFHAPGDTLFLAKALGSAAAMGALVLAWASVFEGHFDTTREAARILEVGIGLAIGAASYVGFLHALGVDEARALIRRLAASVPLLAAR